MKISQQQLRKIIMEEMAAHKQSQMLQEGTEGNPLKVTSEYLKYRMSWNQMVKESSKNESICFFSMASSSCG